MKKITIPGALPPAGHYTPGVASGGMLYVSGQLPMDPFTGELNRGTPGEQARRALENVRLILEAGGSSLDKVVKANVYVSDVAHWPEVNQVYAEIFGGHKPARIVVPCGELHHGALVEIEAVAEA